MEKATASARYWKLEIQNKIVEKFDKTAVESKKNALIKEGGNNLSDQTDAMFAREAHRKEQEAKIKQALDIQILNS